MRKDIQHLELGKSEKAKVKSTSADNFATAEGIELKPTYTKDSTPSHSLIIPSQYHYLS